MKHFQAPFFATLALVCSLTAQADVVVNQEGQDVQVLSAWFGKNLTSSEIDLKRCAEIAPSTRDCTAELERHLGDGSSGFAIHPFVVYGVYSGGNQPGDLDSQYLNCSSVEIRTVTRLSAFNSPVFTGIGFYTGENGGSEVFIPKSKLYSIGMTTLKGGESAIVHRFVGAGYCWRGTMSSSTYQEFTFKPYARFDVANGENQVYRNWESLRTNHALGRKLHSPFVGSWDRSRELLP